jgi:hypothetical protein
MDFCRVCHTSEFRDCKLYDGECKWSAMPSEEYAKMLSEKLLPCPFCGGKPNEDVFFCGIVNGHYSARCIPCAVKLEDDRIDKVIANWNARV